jgi:uncharacterized membrane protein
MILGMSIPESHSRSLVKAVTYRAFGSLSTAVIFFFFTHDTRTSLGAGLLDAVSKIILYFLHERAWTYIPFGRPKTPEYEI